MSYEILGAAQTAFGGLLGVDVSRQDVRKLSASAEFRSVIRPWAVDGKSAPTNNQIQEAVAKSEVACSNEMSSRLLSEENRAAVANALKVFDAFDDYLSFAQMTSPLLRSYIFTADQPANLMQMPSSGMSGGATLTQQVAAVAIADRNTGEETFREALKVSTSHGQGISSLTEPILAVQREFLSANMSRALTLGAAFTLVTRGGPMMATAIVDDFLDLVPPAAPAQDARPSSAPVWAATVTFTKTGVTSTTFAEGVPDSLPVAIAIQSISESLTDGQSWTVPIMLSANNELTVKNFSWMELLASGQVEQPQRIESTASVRTPKDFTDELQRFRSWNETGRIRITPLADKLRKKTEARLFNIQKVEAEKSPVGARHEADQLPLVFYYAEKTESGRANVRMVMAEEDRLVYEKQGRSSEEVDVMIDLAKAYNEVIRDFMSKYSSFDVAERNGVQQGLAIANLIFRPNAFHEIPTGTGKTSTLFACYALFHKKMRDLSGQYQTDEKKIELLHKYYKNASGRLVFVLPDENLFDQTYQELLGADSRLNAANGGPLKFSYFVEASLDKIRDGERSILNDFMASDVCIVLNQAAAFLQLNVENYAAPKTSSNDMKEDERLRWEEGKRNMEAFYGAFTSGNRFIWDEADTLLDMPASQMGDDDRFLGSKGFEYEIPFASLVHETMYAQKIGRSEDGKELTIGDLRGRENNFEIVTAQSRLLTVAIQLKKGSGVQIMSWSKWQSAAEEGGYSGQGLLVDAKFDGKTSS
ncbi:MAG TPA: hypothetical protein PK997_07345, partial [Candidatus Omnitrophota bacterium]|nr:hypothetical protein [Candidatus Omnitrophota bacterium]